MMGLKAINNKPKPELIDDENPEKTLEMFNTAKTTAELLPQLVHCNNESVVDFNRDWQEMQRGEYYPVETLWGDIDFTINEE